MHDLVVQHRFPKRLALARVVNRLVNQPIQRTQRARCSPQPLFLKLHHLEHETHALLPNQVTAWHAHVVKEQLRGVAGVHADLANFLARDAGRVHRHDDERLVLVG